MHLIFIPNGRFNRRSIGVVKGLLYIVAQCIGATLGAGILRVLVPSNVSSNSNELILKNEGNIILMSKLKFE